MLFNRYHIKNFDFKLVFLVLALSIFGYYAIGSAQENLQSDQLMGIIVGTIGMLAVCFIDYHFILRFHWPMYLGNLVLLVLVLVAGKDAGGAQRWLIIGGLRFQPSELAKIILILFFAQFIMKHREHFNTLSIIAACVALVAVPLVLVEEQPDLSTSIMIALIFCVIMFAGGLKWRVIFGILAVAVPTVVILVALAIQPDAEIINPYQKNRILSFINPEEYSDKEAYQQQNSVTAIASGMLNGKGYKNNEITSVKNGNFLSEDQTDFIFAVIGEELGFKGSIAIVVLEMLTAMECVAVGRRAPDLSGAIICSGMGALIGFQSFINLGVATFILPNTGLPLPFVSYGRTSLMSLFFGVGVVLNVRMQVKRRTSPAEEIFK